MIYIPSVLACLPMNVHEVMSPRRIREFVNKNPSPTIPTTYHLNSIKLGFNAIGNSACENIVVASGHTAMNKSIRQSRGTTSLLSTIMAATPTRQPAKVYLNAFATLKISSKKDVCVTSLAVAPHDMSMLRMWQESAWKQSAWCVLVCGFCGGVVEEAYGSRRRRGRL